MGFDSIHSHSLCSFLDSLMWSIAFKNSVDLFKLLNTPQVKLISFYKTILIFNSNQLYKYIKF